MTPIKVGQRKLNVGKNKLPKGGDSKTYELIPKTILI